MKTTSRRKFLTDSAKVTLLTALGTPLLLKAASAQAEVGDNFQFTQPPLPYAYAALEPAIDAQTMEIHYTKHHAAYLKNAGEAMVAENIRVATAEDFFGQVSRVSAKARNNGGGVWNHNFFWQVMKPTSATGNEPGGKLAEALSASFGSVAGFKEQFTQAAMGRFGSGWAWLVLSDNKLKIGSTPNQDNPLMNVSEFRGKPLLGLDVWEHAYYLKYQNKRNEYVGNWWSLVNWDEVTRQLG